LDKSLKPVEGEKEYSKYIHHYYAARSTSLAKEILFINFEVLKRTGNIKKRGEECVSFHSIGLCTLGYYPLPGSNDRRSIGFAVGACIPDAVWVGVRVRGAAWLALTAAVLVSVSLAINGAVMVGDEVLNAPCDTITKLTGVLVFWSSSITTASASCCGAESCVAVPSAAIRSSIIIGWA
jgi:hypothetical protein